MSQHEEASRCERRVLTLCLGPKGNALGHLVWIYDRRRANPSAGQNDRSDKLDQGVPAGGNEPLFG
jgi:hypothetical protein